MEKPDRSTYTALDFAGWKATAALEISPKFQRRGVWTRPAQSYFIDTLLLGMPVPPLYLRLTQSKDNKKVIREVIDGQQRVTAVLEYMEDGYPLSKNIESECKGKRFSELSEKQQKSISQYGMICEVFHGLGDAEVLKIFARLNTYSVALNDQELRNGQFFGPFKSTAYSLAYENIEFWRANKIFSERDIARMREAELVSELIIVLMNGMQDKKKSITSFYEEYDDAFPNRVAIKQKFDRVVDAVNKSMPDGISDTEFRRTPLFYSLFVALAHRMYGVTGFTPASPKKVLTAQELVSVRDALLKLSDVVAAGREDPEKVPKKYEAFLAACLRQTDNLKPRQVRSAMIYKSAFG